MKPSASASTRTGPRLDRKIQYFVRAGVLRKDARDVLHLTAPFVSRLDAMLATVCPYGFRNQPEEVDELLLALWEVQTGRLQRPGKNGAPKRLQDLKSLLCTFRILTRQGLLDPNVFATARQTYPSRTPPYAPEVA